LILKDEIERKKLLKKKKSESPVKPGIRVMKLEEKNNKEKEKKIWINWVSSSNQVNPSNLGFMSWECDN